MADSFDNGRPYRPEAERFRRHGDLRDLVRAACKTCAYEWSAPVVGRCPRCHGTDVEEAERVMVTVPRV